MLKEGRGEGEGEGEEQGGVCVRAPLAHAHTNIFTLTQDGYDEDRGSVGRHIDYIHNTDFVLLAEEFEGDRLGVRGQRGGLARLMVHTRTNTHTHHR
jgi:hypothetical protein